MSGAGMLSDAMLIINHVLKKKIENKETKLCVTITLIIILVSNAAQ